MIKFQKNIYFKARNLTSIWIFIMLINSLFIIQCENGTQAQQTIISEDTTWTLANSPYIIKGNVLIENGVSLTIEPGVEVIFDGFYYMQIEGKIIAEGSENNMITFSSNKSSPAPGDWDTIKFESEAESGSIFSYCNFEYGTIAIDIDVLNIAAPNIIHCNINRNSQTGIKYFTRSSSHYSFNPYNDISNNTITDNGDWGIEIEYNIDIANANLLVHRNLIENNGAGISFMIYEGNLTLTHNTINGNDGTGINCRYYYDFFSSEPINISVRNNIISNNEGNGFTISESPFGGFSFVTIVLEHNTIIFNGGANSENGAGINFLEHKERTEIIIRYNNINNNAPFNGRNGEEFDRNISYNWWGTTDSKIIEQYLFDYYDDFNKGKLNYTPFLTAPDPEAPDPSEYLNEPPNTPTIPNGQVSCLVNSSYTYITSTDDPEENKIRYGWDWIGNRTVVEWSDYIESGDMAEMQHMWTTTGTYHVRVKAADEYGKESEWSDYLEVRIKKEFVGSDDENDNAFDLLLLITILIIIAVIGIIIYKFKRK